MLIWSLSLIRDSLNFKLDLTRIFFESFHISFYLTIKFRDQKLIYIFELNITFKKLLINKTPNNLKPIVINYIIQFIKPVYYN
jgi:hypothetical protein